MIEWIIIVAAGFFGGALNAVAGGGSFITLPALIFAGVPPVVANATGTAALLPGYIASAWRFRHDIEFPAGIKYSTIMLIAIIGGSVGAVILLFSSEQLFLMLIPWLILFATTIFFIGPRLIGKAKQLPSQATNTIPVQRPHSQKMIAFIVLFLVCVYGGYFNGGLGIILLAALGLLGQTNLIAMNGVKNIVSALLTAIAVVVYAAGGVIASEHLWVLSVAAIVGGYVGATFAYRISQRALRIFIVAVGILMTLGFFLT
ncbi:sulfite exporter TauE/SafE family protein [Candidatus Nitrotoga sp. M5]|uniref:sulfite exporter TauE/SafE family protein n=1 Tax=Candidatus Nitrotoga sp. M5 TaxID=2890409 RepID=UPI001EF2561A|nr:sulfite exporter TauE/SafE family protein [Candidatus Nitrotoga sp. M5]CAH1386748.1 putative membrane transporter protein [Candidatus Nitrotoga sp. M5]